MFGQQVVGSVDVSKLSRSHRQSNYSLQLLERHFNLVCGGSFVMTEGGSTN